MRFSNLKIGEHFFFEGLEYTKTSPVLACDTNGNSRFIPRSAVTQAHPAQSPQPPRNEETKLDKLYQVVTHLIRQEVRDSDLEIKLRQAVEKAWRNIKDNSD